MRKLLIEGLIRRPLTEPAPKPDDAALDALGRRVGAALHRRLGRSLAIRMVDAGSCNGCELEINALGNPFYDLERFGLRFVASPRHADVLMVTGPVTHNMAEALRRSWDAVPEPRWVVAVGDCAGDGGCFAGSYAVAGGARRARRPCWKACWPCWSMPRPEPPRASIGRPAPVARLSRTAASTRTCRRPRKPHCPASR